MDLSHLHVFVTVLETGSISNAARKLFVSQPAISMKINELEVHYQVKLLERTNKGVKPTEQGLYVYQEGQKILSMAKNLEQQLTRPSNRLEELQIGATGTLGSYFLPSKIIQFQELHPQYRILLNINTCDQVVMQMLNKSIDLGFVEGPLENELIEQCGREGLAVDLLAEDELVIVANQSIEAGGDTLHWNDFKSMPLILKIRGTGIRATVEKILVQQGLSIDDLNIVLEVNRIDAVVSAVVANKGVSLLPHAMLNEMKVKEMRLAEFAFSHAYHTIYNPSDMIKHPFDLFFGLFDNGGAEGSGLNMGQTG